MLKIVIVSRNFRFEGGVIKNVVEQLLKYLNKEKIKAYHFPIGKNPNRLFNILLPVFILYQVIKFNILLKKKKPDVVHFNPSFGTIPMLRDGIFLRITNRYKIPVLFFIHGWTESFYQKLKKNKGHFSNFYLNSLIKADGIVVLAMDFKKKLVELRVNKSKIHILTPMVEINKYRPKNVEIKFKPPYQLVFCSRIEKVKGIYELLAATQKVLKKRDDIKLVYLGKGSELKNLTEKVINLDLQDKIEVKGYVDDNTKYRILKDSTIFVFPSYHSEGFPAVVLEAMASGLPLITTNVAGLKDALTNGKQGYILNSSPVNVNFLSKQILRLLQNPSSMTQMGLNNIEEVEKKYDVLPVTKKIEKIYNKVHLNVK